MAVARSPSLHHLSQRRPFPRRALHTSHPSHTMKAGTLQIVWHAKDPVYSLDFHPSGLLATAGGDKEIKVGVRGGTV